MALALEIVILVAGGLAMLVLLPRGSERRRRRNRVAEPARPADLERLERLVVTGRSSAGSVHFRLRPLLAEIAVARLGEHRVRLDRDQERARRLLGDELWELVRSDRRPPEDLRGPGMSLEELTEMTERLERL